MFHRVFVNEYRGSRHTGFRHSPGLPEVGSIVPSRYSLVTRIPVGAFQSLQSPLFLAQLRRWFDGFQERRAPKAAQQRLHKRGGKRKASTLREQGSKNSAGCGGSHNRRAERVNEKSGAQPFAPGLRSEKRRRDEGSPPLKSDTFFPRQFRPSFEQHQ